MYYVSRRTDRRLVKTERQPPLHPSTQLQDGLTCHKGVGHVLEQGLHLLGRDQLVAGLVELFFSVWCVGGGLFVL